MNILEVNELTKNYKDNVAVKGISFNVKQGDFFAFLGKNGAGKSTTINIISTLLSKTSGEVIVNDYKLDKEDMNIRNSIGVVFQDNKLDEFLTVKENLVTRGKLYKLSKNELNEQISSLIDQLNAEDIINKRYGQLSGGQRRKADIMRALINEPKFLILDEPTTGLDPHTRKQVWETLERIRNEKKLTIFLTTHYMEEASTADKIIVIDKGSIIDIGTPEELRAKHTDCKLTLFPNNNEVIIKKLKELNQKYLNKENTIIIDITTSLEAINIINNVKDYIHDFEFLRGSMDDMFINITKEEF